ncbi:TMV resistance protein N-like [Dorcoceras hygrometricum]|uniref:TMV resistance protein N-like n=1 Tax=Dorcoceras hygrometricum TaxID=472368 RepID=A0A2Z7CJX9_9LAMI|nr:TMV resistance protein N-like [Dorcoceras hygrometricum]
MFDQPLGCSASPANSRRFRTPFFTIKVALDSSRKALSFHTNLGGCRGLEKKHEGAVFVHVFRCSGWIQTSRGLNCGNCCAESEIKVWILSFKSVHVFRCSGWIQTSRGLNCGNCCAESEIKLCLAYCAVVFLPGCEGERRYCTLISLLGLLATMRRVVNYHSSWARQRQVDLFDASDLVELCLSSLAPFPVLLSVLGFDPMSLWGLVVFLACCVVQVSKVIQLVEVLTQLEVPQEVVRVSQ